MKEGRTRSHRNQLGLQFKQKCKEILKQQPKNYLSTSIKDNHINIDISIFAAEDLPFFQIMLGLPVHKLTVCTPDPNDQKAKSPSKNKNKDPQALQVKTFPETPKFRDFMAAISQAIESNQHLKMVRIQRIPMAIRALKQLKPGVQKSRSLRQLALAGCHLTDGHLEAIKDSLSQNTSLMTLDLSNNKLCDVGGMIGHVLAQHSRRRNEVVFFLNIRGQIPADDLSNSGLCQVNLEYNKLTDKSIADLVTSLKTDSWTKCINLRHNLIKSQGIKQLAFMLKNNTSLISLDLRGNEGLSRQYSRFIYKKLVLNMQRYKQHKQIFQKSKTLRRGNDSNHNNTPSKQKESEHIDVELSKYKSAKQHFYGRYDSKQYTTIAEPPRQLEKNNMTLDRKIIINSHESKLIQPECPNCKAKTFEMLRLEKKTLDLELQLKKVKHALLTKNIDISAIMPNGNNQSVLEWLSNKSNQNDDELLQRMQQIMMELTRVIQTIEQHQNTKENLTNPLDNPNSFSNTIQLYEKHSHLQDLSKEIEEEERLRAVFERSHSSEDKMNVLEGSQAN